MSSNASLSSMQRLVEQLKLEAGVERIKVSQAAAELQQYYPVLYSEVRERRWRVFFKHEMNNSCLSFSRKHYLCALLFLWPKQSPRYLSVYSGVSVVH
ncbi:unnamed protein product [Caretta caretta]